MMRTIRILAACLIALAIVILGAWLPKLATDRQTRENEARVHPVQELSLIEQPLTVIDRLCLSSLTPESIPVAEDKAHTTREEASELAYDCFFQYADALTGLFPQWEPVNCEIVYLLNVGEGTGGTIRSNHYWRAVFTSDAGDSGSGYGCTFVVAFDDETGMLGNVYCNVNSRLGSAGEIFDVLDKLFWGDLERFGVERQMLDGYEIGDEYLGKSVCTDPSTGETALVSIAVGNGYYSINVYREPSENVMQP